ncbi:DNA-binding PucR family transcriptional regulator [Mumia flava]|uniref:DNA-binding PucR family transcriptional regulator n=1 Tax=Mumia flava TaxID=1348852 RepID=A0A2M9B6Y4_9ACTN|nr:DNA-binding PucR family transcriptional regulator [Mumia flava]
MVEDLGTTLLHLACGDADSTAEISSVVFYDPLDDAVPPNHAIVLAVGVREPHEVVALLDRLGAHQAAGLVVRGPVEVDDTCAETVARAGVPLLGLTPGASWAQLAAMLRSLIAEGDVGEAEPETLGGLPSGDLFALANAIGTLLDAPVTIEDRSSRVLAFSGRQDEADPSRVETVLGRQVPQRYTRILEERGVFRELYRSTAPVRVQPLASDGDFAIPRVALAVRAGDEILGSIWAAVRSPLSTERSQALQDSAKLVALHLLRMRAGADVERRLRADLVATALEAGPGSSEAIARLGLADQTCLVLAMATGDAPSAAAGEGPRHVAERQRLADAFALHLSAVYPRSATAPIGDVVYGIVGVRRDSDDVEERAERIATEFLDWVGAEHPRIGIGPAAPELAGLARSRSGADRALRVLAQGTAVRRVARISEVRVDALVIELADLAAARGDGVAGPVARLVAYDAKRGASLVETLRAWLDAFGDVAAASAAVYTHPNTFRYRLRRLAEVGGLDLDDPDARFAAMLELRLMGSTPAG